MYRVALVLCLALLASFTIVAMAQQTPVSQNAAGDYTIRFVAGGEQKEFTFERATHVLPDVRVQVARATTDGNLTYTYRVANGSGARQEIHSFTITDASTASIASEPPDWKGDTVPQRGRVYWLRLSKTSRRGIPPGQSVDAFIVRSKLLPGPTTAELRGATEVPKVTPVVPESALRQLRTLLERDFVTALTVGPVIAGFSPTEPELTTDVFMARVKNRFAVPLVRSGHPDAESLMTAFDQAIAAGGGSATVKALAAIEQIARRPSPTPIVNELNQALLINFEHARAAGR